MKGGASQTCRLYKESKFTVTQTHSKLAYFVYKKRKGGNQEGNALAAVVFQTKTKGGVPKLHRV